MNVGMLWLPANPKPTFHESVAEAADFFKKKYGRRPDLCLVNPQNYSALTKADLEPVQAITVRPWRSVQLNHFWIGVDDMPAYALESVEANARQVREKAV